MQKAATRKYVIKDGKIKEQLKNIIAEREASKREALRRMKWSRLVRHFAHLS